MGGVCPWIFSTLCPFAVLAQSLVQGEVEEGDLCLFCWSLSQSASGGQAARQEQQLGVRQAENTLNGLKVACKTGQLMPVIWAAI